MYYITRGFYSEMHIENYNKIEKLLNRDVFDGFLLKYYDCVNNSSFDKLKRIIKIDFQDRINFINDIKLKNDLNKVSIIKSWYDLLQNFTKNSSDIKENQKLAQYISSEAKLKKTIEINNKIIELNHITPRLLWECRYNVIIIKSSAYLVGVQASCEDYMISKRQNIINSYTCNLGKTNMYGLRPMAYFHPHLPDLIIRIQF